MDGLVFFQQCVIFGVLLGFVLSMLGRG